MHYYVDGYNLLFRFLKGEDNLQQKRQHLIEDLNAKVELLKLNMTLVFDSQHQLGEETRGHFHNLEILFSGYGETADDKILREIKREPYPHQCIVVTSDKKLAWFARRCSAKTETVEQFVEGLNKRYKNKLLKKPSAPAKPLVKKEIEVKPPTKPTAKASVTACFDYYLEKFEKEFSQLEESKPKKESKKAQTTEKKRKKKDIPVRRKPLSEQEETERWLLIFEKNFIEEK